MFRRIRWRLLVTYFIVVISACVFLGAYLTQRFTSIYTDRVTADLRSLAESIALDAAANLSAGDPRAVQRDLRGAHAPGEAWVLVTDASRTIVGTRGVPGSRLGASDTEPLIRNALQGAEATRIGPVPGAEEAVHAVVPVRTAPGSPVLGVVHVMLPLTRLHATLRQIRWVVAWAVVIALVIGGGVGLILARGIAGPIQEMQRVAGKLAAGHLSERVPVRSRDEVGELAGSFNHMASELERIDATRRAFIADASHELRTPVANLAVAIEALQAVIGKDPDQARAASADLEREVRRLTELVEDLLDLSLAESGAVHLNLTAQSPGDLILRATRPFQARAAEAGVTLATEIPARLSQVKADADRTVQVLTNLLDNAFKVTTSRGRITVAASEQRAHVLLSVTDTGSGIPEAELAHIFDRFYRVDKARTRGQGGAGLGLAIAKRLVEAQGGIIMVESKPGQGTRFVVALQRIP